MDLIHVIKAEKITAMKNKDKFVKDILTTLIGEIEIVGKNDGNRTTTDAEAIKVIQKFAKGIKETIELTKPKGFVELQAELDIYEAYLPKTLTEQEIRDIVEPIARVSKSMGDVMGKIRVYDGMDMKLASKICREIM